MHVLTKFPAWESVSDGELIPRASSSPGLGGVKGDPRLACLPRPVAAKLPRKSNSRETRRFARVKSVVSPTALFT